MILPLNFYYLFIFSGLIWCVTIITHYIRFGVFKLKRFGFSERNYYIFTSSLLLTVLLTAVTENYLEQLLFFIIFGVAGIIGETAFSIWWKSFYQNRFFTYSVDTLMNKETSVLNFIPWGIGGLLYIEILRFVLPDSFFSIEKLNVFYFLAAAFLVCIALEYGVFYLMFKRSHPEYPLLQKVTLSNFLFFCLPAFIPLVALIIIYGKDIIVLTTLFALIASFTEYMLGKASEVFISKKLWTYNYLAFDKGHFTPLSLPFFALGGYYFWLVGLIITLILSK